MWNDIDGPIYDISRLAFSGEMAEQATKQNVAICCRCKPFHLFSLSDKTHIVVYQIVIIYFSWLECNNHAVMKLGTLAHFWPFIVVIIKLAVNWLLIINISLSLQLAWLKIFLEGFKFSCKKLCFTRINYDIWLIFFFLILFINFV